MFKVGSKVQTQMPNLVMLFECFSDQSRLLQHLSKAKKCRHFPCKISDFAALIVNGKFDSFPVNTWSLNALRLKEMDKNTMLEVFEQLDRLEGEDDGHLHQNRFLSLEATKQKLFCLRWSNQGFINKWGKSYQKDASQKP